MIERSSVHAPPKAIVDSVLDEIDLAAPGAVLREPRVASNPRHGVRLHAVPEVAAGAAQRIADVMWETVPGREQNRPTAQG